MQNRLAMIAVGLGLAAPSLTALPVAAATKDGPLVFTAVRFDVSTPLREMPVLQRPSGEEHVPPIRHVRPAPPALAAKDPVLEMVALPAPAMAPSAPHVVIEGQGVDGVVPPDTKGRPA